MSPYESILAEAVEEGYAEGEVRRAFQSGIGDLFVYTKQQGIPDEEVKNKLSTIGLPPEIFTAHERTGKTLDERVAQLTGLVKGVKDLILTSKPISDAYTPEQALDESYRVLGTGREPIFEWHGPDDASALRLTEADIERERAVMADAGFAARLKSEVQQVGYILSFPRRYARAGMVGINSILGALPGGTPSPTPEGEISTVLGDAAARVEAAKRLDYVPAKGEKVAATLGAFGGDMPLLYMLGVTMPSFLPKADVLATLPRVALARMAHSSTVFGAQAAIGALADEMAVKGMEVSPGAVAGAGVHGAAFGAPMGLAGAVPALVAGRLPAAVSQGISSGLIPRLLGATAEGAVGAGAAALDGGPPDDVAFNAAVFFLMGIANNQNYSAQYRQAAKDSAIKDAVEYLVKAGVPPVDAVAGARQQLDSLLAMREKAWQDARAHPNYPALVSQTAEQFQKFAPDLSPEQVRILAEKRVETAFAVGEVNIAELANVKLIMTPEEVALKPQSAVEGGKVAPGGAQHPAEAPPPAKAAPAQPEATKEAGSGQKQPVWSDGPDPISSIPGNEPISLLLPEKGAPQETALATIFDSATKDGAPFKVVVSGSSIPNPNATKQGMPSDGWPTYEAAKAAAEAATVGMRRADNPYGPFTPVEGTPHAENAAAFKVGLWEIEHEARNIMADADAAYLAVRQATDAAGVKSAQEAHDLAMQRYTGILKDVENTAGPAAAKFMDERIRSGDDLRAPVVPRLANPVITEPVIGVKAETTVVSPEPGKRTSKTVVTAESGKTGLLSTGGKVLKHFTTLEGRIALEGGAPFDFSKLPQHGTGDLSDRPKTGRFAGKRLYLSMDDKAWSNITRDKPGGTVMTADEAIKKGVKGDAFYDYDKQKWMMKVGGTEEVSLESVSYRISPDAKTITIDSMLSLKTALDEASAITGKRVHFDEDVFYEALQKRYDILEIRNVEKLSQKAKFFKYAMADQAIVFNPSVAEIVKPSSAKYLSPAALKVKIVAPEAATLTATKQARANELMAYRVRDGYAYSSDGTVSLRLKSSQKDGIYRFIGKEPVVAGDTEYPEPPKFPETRQGYVGRDSLLSAMKRAETFVAGDDRPGLNVYSLRQTSKGLFLVATDGKKAVVLKVDGTLEPGEYRLPASKTLAAGASALTGKDLTVHADSVGDKRMVIGLRGENGDLRAQVQDANYPKVGQLFGAYNEKLTIDKKALVAALKEVAPFAKANAGSGGTFGVTLRRAGDALEIVSEGSQTTPTKIVQVEAKWERGQYNPVEGALVMPMRGIGKGMMDLNLPLMIDALKSVSGDTVYLGYRGDSAPFHIGESGKDSQIKGRDLDAFETPVEKPAGKRKAKVNFEQAVEDNPEGRVVTAGGEIKTVDSRGVRSTVEAGTKGKVAGRDFETEMLFVDFGKGPVLVEPTDLAESGVKHDPPEPQMDLSRYDVRFDQTRVSGKENLDMDGRTKDRVNKQQILDFAERAFDVPIRDRLSKRMGKAIGHYEIIPHLVRLKEWGDIPVAAHEVAHAVDHVLRRDLGKRWKNDVARLSPSPGEAMKELHTLDYDQQQRRATEGFAEFIRHYVTTGEAPSKAPLFHAAFEKFLEGRQTLKADLLEFRRLYNVWQEQGAEARMDAQTDYSGELSRKNVPLRESAKSVFEWFYDRAFDEFDVARRMEADYKNRGGKDLPPEKSVYQLLTYFKYKSRAVAYNMVTRSMVDAAGNRVGPSLMEVLAPIEVSVGDVLPPSVTKILGLNEKFKTFVRYSLARRAIVLGARGIESGFGLGDARHVFMKYDNPVWRKASDGITQWADQVLDYMMAGHRLSPETIETIRDRNPVYLRLKRVFIDDADRFRSGQKVFGYDKGVKKIYGSGRPVYNPIESMIEQSAEQVSLGMKGMVANAAFEMSSRPGMGRWITKMDNPLEAKRVSTDAVIEELRKDGWEIKRGKESEEEFSQVLTIFAQGSFYKGKGNVVPVIRGDKVHFLELHPDLYRAFQGLDHPELGNVMQFLGAFKRLVQLGATGLNPTFALASNPIRDPLTFGMFTKERTLNPFQPLMGTVRELASVPGDAADRFVLSGGRTLGLIGADRRELQAVYHEMKLDRLPAGKVLKLFVHPMDALQEIFSIPEAGPRITEYTKMSARYRREYPEWSDFSIHIKAMNDAADVTVNFSRGGLWSKYIGTAVPYFNAGMQSMDKIGRTVAENPLEFGMRGAYFVTLPAVAAWMVSRDKEWYKNIPEGYRFSNMFFEVGDAVYHLPLPFEPGLAFGALPVSVLDAMYRKGGNARKNAEEIGRQALRTLPNPLNVALVTPLWEIGSNKDWLDRPIETPDMESKPVKDRSRPHTTSLAKNMSAGMVALGMDFSPVQVEHFLNGISGGAYNRLRFLGGTKDIADLPVIGGLTLRIPERPQRQMQEMFENIKTLSQKKKVGEATPQELVDLAKYKNIEAGVFKVHNRIIKDLYAKDAPIGKIREQYYLMGKEMARLGLE